MKDWHSIQDGQTQKRSIILTKRCVLLERSKTTVLFLNICASDEALLSRIHTGFIFDKIIRNDDLYQYMVYFPEFKMINRFTSRHDKENLSAQTFKLYIFMDENQLKQKIRIELQ